jgi:hypothetical protein
MIFFKIVAACIEEIDRARAVVLRLSTFVYWAQDRAIHNVVQIIIMRGDNQKYFNRFVCLPW